MTPLHAHAKLWIPSFLTALARTGNVSDAATAAGIVRATAYCHRQTDPEFASAWDAALEVATDALEAEARRRAITGSDVLLMFLLRAHRPSKFRENVQHDHGGEITFRLEYADDFTPPASSESADDPP